MLLQPYQLDVKKQNWCKRSFYFHKYYSNGMPLPEATATELKFQINLPRPLI